MMRHILLTATLLLSLCWITGCGEGVSTQKSGGLVDNAAQRRRRIAAINDVHMRQLQDDWDLFWLYDENLNLSQWETHVGP
jgi:hypothetical protein